MWSSAIKATATHGPKVVGTLTGMAGVARSSLYLYDCVKEFFKKPETCPVCKREIDEKTTDVEKVPVKLPNCGHWYHLRCLNCLREIQNICAVCEQEI